jgi:hypothetical protein
MDTDLNQLTREELLDLRVCAVPPSLSWDWFSRSLLDPADPGRTDANTHDLASAASTLGCNRTVFSARPQATS